MPVRVVQNSRLRLGKLNQSGESEYWDVLVLEDALVSPRADDRLHRVVAGDRLDLIANTYYGDPALWWVIALANNIELAPSGLTIGDELRIPSPSWVRSGLFTGKR